MILDELRSENIPFDLGAYRVIQFKGDLTGIAKLAKQLEAFIQELGKPETHRDNPVHDWLPALPPNAIESSKGSIEGELREKLARAENRIRTYEQVYGVTKDTSSGDEQSPLSIVLSVLSESESGNLPSDLMRRAESTSRERDFKEFISVIRRVIERNVRLSERDFQVLASYCNNLGLSDVAGAVYAHALKVQPKSQEIRRNQLGHFAHSDDPALRARARQEILKEINITIEEGKEVSCPELTKDSVQLLGLMLDAFHSDSLHEQALAITQAALVHNSTSSVVLRNHARALENIGNADESLEFYRKSIYAADADDSSMTWFGTELHNRKRNVDATEVYLLACLSDPDDAEGFSHVADEISWTMVQAHRLRLSKSTRELPESITLDVVETALIPAVSCRILSYRSLDRIRSVTERLGLSTDKINSVRMTFEERVRFASQLYNEFESELTRAL